MSNEMVRKVLRELADARKRIKQLEGRVEALGMLAAVSFTAFKVLGAVPLPFHVVPTDDDKLPKHMRPTKQKAAKPDPLSGLAGPLHARKAAKR